MLIKCKRACGYLMTEKHFRGECALYKYCMYLHSSDKNPCRRWFLGRRWMRWGCLGGRCHKVSAPYHQHQSYRCSLASLWAFLIEILLPLLSYLIFKCLQKLSNMFRCFKLEFSWCSLCILVSYETLKIISIHIQKKTPAIAVYLLKLTTLVSCKSPISIHFCSCLHQIFMLPMAMRGSQLPYQTTIFFTIFFLYIRSAKWLDLMQCISLCVFSD